MRTHPDFLRQGVGAALLEQIVSTARTRGMFRLSLETGSGTAFPCPVPQAGMRWCGFRIAIRSSAAGIRSRLITVQERIQCPLHYALDLCARDCRRLAQEVVLPHLPVSKQRKKMR